MRKLNYRRGLQRVYAVASILWIAIMLALSIHDRPHRIDYDALAKQARWTEVDPSEVTALPAAPPRQKVDAPIGRYTDADLAPSPGEWLKNNPARPLPSESWLPYWTRRAALAVLPPGLGYLFIFWVLPWIWRGFASDTENSK